MFVKKITLENGENIKKLYLKSFPKNERIAFKSLWSGIFSSFEMFGFFDESNNLIGMIHLNNTKNFVHVNYLAVETALRSRGYGSQILQWVKDNYINKSVVLDVEYIDNNASNAVQRERRLKFYKKNGFKIGKYMFDWRNSLMTYLHYGKINAKEFMSYIQTIFPDIQNVTKL